MAAFLSVGCGEDAPTEPTAADEAESGQTTDNEEAGDPSKEESNNAEFGSEAGK